MNEDYAVFGTPLDPIHEDEVARKRPIYIQDQIATDSQGRRRFHGAFTGGFSAGFFNSVGTPEGWIPSTFKSSRESKAESRMQKPEDFMDEEDTDVFGIAPSVLRAKPEYGGSSDRGRKRERVTFSDGPIPGEPVLQGILRPAKETIGVLLLMKMGWKPGQGIGPRISKIEKKRQNKENKKKVYGCFMPGKQDSDSEDEVIDVNQLFAPDDVEQIFIKPKTDKFGLGYSGLDKNLLSLHNIRNQDTFRMLDNNKKLAIKGQAFGVGAFEEEDADIYARDDLSNYDFALETTNSLKEKRRKERAEKQLLALTYGSKGVVDGFVPAKKPPVLKKFFLPPKIPPGFDGRHSIRKTRFGPEHKNLPEIKHKKQILTAEDRAAILDETPKIKVEKIENLENVEKKEEIDEKMQIETDSSSFRPFIADPAKQSRYEKFLNFVKIGAKDAFSTIQPKDMSDWEKERERNEFEQASRLYKPLSGLMADRFASAELPDESLDPLAPVQRYVGNVDAALAKAAKEKKFGKLTRSRFEWVPVSLLCKRMNIAEPNSDGVSLSDVADEKNRKKKIKFSAFDFLADGGAGENFWNDEPEIPKIENKEEDVEKSENKEEKKEFKSVIPFEDPAEKIDLFKAIFCSDESEDEEKEDEKNKNVLRNTSPPRGIFANLDLDALKKKPETQVEPTKTAETSKIVEPDPQLLYGPSLPSKPVFNKPSTSHISSSSSSDEVEWVEKTGKSPKKKHKKDKKKEKHKKKSSKKKKKHKD